MPSELHEVLAEMLRAKPEVLLVLLRIVRTDLPEAVSASVVGEALSPPLVPDYRPDCVVVIRDEGATVVRVVISEVQIHRDEAKLWTLPAYQALARARHRAPYEVAVV